MKTIILCDGPRPIEISKLSRTYGLGIEVQAFCVPELYLENNLQGIEQVKEEIKGIPFNSFHGPYRDLNTGTPDKLISNVVKFRYQQAFDIACELNISHMVFHNGCLKRDKRYESWIKNSIIFWLDFLSDKSENFNFFIENLFEHSPELILYIINAINKKNVKACLDIGHAHCYTDHSVMTWIQELGNSIGYVHMHDNDGSSDSHSDFGEGNIPLVEVCECLENYAPDTIWSLETDGGDTQKSINWLLEKGYLKR